MAWFTNLDIKKRHEELILVKRYDPEQNLKYINYDAIEISKVSDIPCDFNGEMAFLLLFWTNITPSSLKLLA